MRRFNYDENEEYREDVDKFFGEDQEELTPEQYQAILEDQQAIQQMQIKFVYRDLNHRLLRSAMRMCEKSFWWRFYSQATRLNKIDSAYKYLRNLEEE